MSKIEELKNTIGRNGKVDELVNVNSVEYKLAQKDKTIADLEAKLAESEKKLALCEELRDVEETEYSKDISKTNSALFRKCQQTSRLIEENTQLKQQLAEKEKEIENCKEEHKFVDDLSNYFETLNLQELKNAISEQIEINLPALVKAVETEKKSKTEFAIEKLQRVRHEIPLLAGKTEGETFFVNYQQLRISIDQIINEIRTQKE